MQLTAEQQVIARQWIADGMKLSDFQKRVEADFGLKLTYMETRFLVDDLKVLPKDPEPPKREAPKPDAPVATAPAEPVPGPGGVALTVDAVTRPGTLVSGRVTFSDGQGGMWYLDQYGRPGFGPDTKGYRPSPADLQEFQMALEKELVRLGM
jgi:hypothetical protein